MCLTQATTYKLIMKCQNPRKPSHKSTLTNLNLAQETINDLEKCHPTDKCIWVALLTNRCNLSTNIRNFLWKLIHNTHKCRKYWLKMANLSKRGACTKCRTPEMMQHIVFNCKANQSTVIWNIAKKLCKMKEIIWPEGLDITTIMALPLLKIQSENGETQHGVMHLFLIVISECAFQI